MSPAEKTVALINRGRLSPFDPSLRRSWQSLVALFTAWTFLLLLGTASTHHHKSSLAEHDCAVCSAVFDKVADLAVAATLVAAIDVIAYHVLPVAALRQSPQEPILFSLSRGPPRASL